jgi:hypothetical protein
MIMKYLPFCLVLLPGTLVAQLPYTSQNSAPGHVRRTYEYRKNLELNGAMVNLVTSGVNVNWDLSAHPLTGPVIENVYFEPSAGTPWQSTYPSANLVIREGEPPGAVFHTYMSNTTFEMRAIGGVYQSGGEHSLITFCPNPFLIMEYPMTIGSGVQNVYNCAGGGGHIDHWTIMATGNVTFAGGTINNLVMWRSIYDTGFVKDTSYFWTQSDNVMFPVISYNPGVQLKVYKPIWDHVLNVGNELHMVDLLIAPNPAVDELNITLGTTLDEALNIHIVDALGREVLQPQRIHPSDERLNLRVGSLAPGSYVVELRGREGIRGRRVFVKQ